MSYRYWVEGIRRVVKLIACEKHRPIDPAQGCPWCRIEELENARADGRPSSSR